MAFLYVYVCICIVVIQYYVLIQNYITTLVKCNLTSDCYYSGLIAPQECPASLLVYYITRVHYAGVRTTYAYRRRMIAIPHGVVDEQQQHKSLTQNLPHSLWIINYGRIFLKLLPLLLQTHTHTHAHTHTHTHTHTNTHWLQLTTVCFQGFTNQGIIILTVAHTFAIVQVNSWLEL